MDKKVPGNAPGNAENNVPGKPPGTTDAQVIGSLHVLQQPKRWTKSLQSRRGATLQSSAARVSSLWRTGLPMTSP
jgi:hypothetical protein